MKNIKKYLALVLVTTFFFGCTDLEETPTDILSPEGFYNTAEDVETVTRSAYGLLANQLLWADVLPLYLWLSSDMCSQSGFGALGVRKSYDLFPIEAGNVHIENAWKEFYKIISAANSAIEGASFLEVSEAEKNEAQASARFIRGYAYYFIAMLWGDAPYLDEFVRDTDAIKDIKSTSEATIMARAIEDVQFAKDYLSPNTPINIRSLPTKGTAAALLASIYLYTKDYEGAYREAKWVIDNKTTYNYNLEPDFQDLWIELNADNLTEPIFTIDYLFGINQGGLNRDWLGPLTTVRGSTAGGWGLAIPETEVFDSWDEEDPRKRISMLDSTYFTVNGEQVLQPFTKFPLLPRPHIKKFATNFRPDGPANGNNSGQNPALIRYAEILLIAAEAGAEVNGVSTEVEGYVNEVRARARVSGGKNSATPADVTTGLSKDDFIELVLEERRLELAFEFKRWFDIKRRDLGDEVFKTNPNRLEDRPNFSAPRDYYWYIPEPVLSVNPNLAEVED